MIFHLQLMEHCIEKCLLQAKMDGYRTIAFPTLGCGHLNFPPNDVTACFDHAAKTVPGLKVRPCPTKFNLLGRREYKNCFTDQITKLVAGVECSGGTCLGQFPLN